MHRLFDCFFPPSSSTPLTSTRSFTPSQRLSASKLSKPKQNPSKRNAPSKVYHSGAEMGVPSARLLRAWQLDVRQGRTEHLDTAVKKFVGELEFRNKGAVVDHEYTLRAVNLALPGRVAWSIRIVDGWRARESSAASGSVVEAVLGGKGADERRGG